MRDGRPTITALREELYARSILQRGLVSVGRGLRAVGFWAAVVLPFLYGPLLLSGLDSRADSLAFGVLFATHVVALVVGHQYEA